MIGLDVEQPTWVFIHGWGSNQSLWQALLAHLPGQVLLLDLPGFGEHENSDQPSDVPESWQAYVAQATAQLPDGCILVGWSLGGAIATQVAARAPGRVRALITLASNPCFVATEEWPDAMAAEVFAKFCADFDDQPTKTWLRFCALQAQGDRARKAVQQTLKQQPQPAASVIPVWRELLAWLGQIDNRGALGKLSCPHLHLFGEGDALVPRSAAGAVARIGRAEAVVLCGLGHAPHLSDPLAVSERILKWLPAQRRISKTEIARSFSAAVSTYDAAAHVQRQVANLLVEGSGDFDATDQVLDLGCGTGFVSQALQARAQAPAVVLADLAEAMVGFARAKQPGVSGTAADAEALPFASCSFDAVLSSLALQWCHDLTQVGHEVKACLRPGGRFVFSTLGPATLQELKQAWRQVDSYVHVNEFKSIEQIQAELTAAGLVLESIRRAPIVLHYRQLLPLLRELKAIGAHNLNPGRNLGLSLRSQFKQLEQAYIAAADKQGLLPATYDVLLVTAIKP